ncbi:phage baseplate assembly protein V [Streptomyces sp. NPDC058326]|uniref:phage baseplate assembly protein V n=1 Tax=Streptomyces sp. NPDC058326 TaxID=3346447 RepID=UPI0036E2A89C
MATPAAATASELAGGVPDLPEFAVKLAGQPLDPQVRLDVLELDVSAEVLRHGRAVLLVRNWNPDAREVRYSDTGPFVPGTAMEISLGWRGALEPVFRGVVTGVTARFGTASGPVLEVDCRTRSVLLAAVPRARVHEDTTDGEVVAHIAAAYGLTADEAPGIRQPLVAFSGRSDWDWVTGRAAELGYVAYVADDRLVFRPAAAPGGDDLSLAYGTTLRELKLTREVSGRADPVSYAGFDSTTLEAVVAEADSGRAEQGGRGRPTPAEDLRTARWPLRAAHLGYTTGISVEEADRRAVAAASGETLRHLHGTGSALGMPRLRADSWVRLTGIGSTLGGSHYVSAVRHRLGRRGYTTEFQVGSPPPLRPQAPAAAPGGRGTAAAGASAVTDGLVLGLVQDLDDPLGLGRVKVAFPWLAPAAEPVWSRLSTLSAGSGHGTWFVPDVGQEVLVGFIGDDHRFPVVLGALWNGRAAPPERMDPKTNGIRSVVTRSGHRLTFDDAAGGRIALTTAAGHRLELDDGKGEVVLTEKGGGCSVALSSGGVAITARSGDITLSAPAGAVKVAAASFTAKSTGVAAVESAAALELKAAGVLSVTGALVKIN